MFLGDFFLHHNIIEQLLDLFMFIQMHLGWMRGTLLIFAARVTEAAQGHLESFVGVVMTITSKGLQRLGMNPILSVDSRQLHK